MSVTTRARCDWSVQSPIKRGENRRRFSPSLLMVKEESDCKGERGERQWGKFPRRCKKKGGYWLTLTTQYVHRYLIDSVKKAPNSNRHFCSKDTDFRPHHRFPLRSSPVLFAINAIIFHVKTYLLAGRITNRNPRAK